MRFSRKKLRVLTVIPSTRACPDRINLALSEAEGVAEEVAEWAEASYGRNLVLNLAFWKSIIFIRKARTRFTYKLFLTLRPIK
ncbi:MAG: hypothetical protein ACE5HX_17900 [bacterium]